MDKFKLFQKNNNSVILPFNSINKYKIKCINIMIICFDYIECEKIIVDLKNNEINYSLDNDNIIMIPFDFIVKIINKNK